MKKILIYICIICLTGLNAYAGIHQLQDADGSFAANALKEGSFPLTFDQESTTTPWVTANNGVVMSSNKDADSEVGFSTTFNLSFDANVSFDWSVNGDELIFYVDNNQITNISGIISNYTPYTYSLKAGIHTLKWSYKNSSEATTGDDRGYVKNIYILPTAFIMPGVGYPVCESQLYFGNVVKDAPTTVNLNIRNIGSEQLSITDVTVSDASFVIEEYEKNIPALETRSIPFTVTATAEGLIEAKATIITTGGTREVALRANCTSNITTYTIAAPGNLSNMVNESDYATITNLKLTGEINDIDIAFIKQNLTAVKTLDLLDASFADNTINTQFQKSTWVTVILPKGTETIDYSAFRDCENLQSLVLPEGLKTIGGNAFHGCVKLKDITLPSSLETMGGEIFADCSSLLSVIVPEKVQIMENYTFAGCSSLINVVIGNRVTTLGDYTFDGCGNLESIVLGDGLTKVENLFSNKTKLKQVTFGKKITSIANYCFSECTSLTEINLPNIIQSIGNSAFSGCTNLQTINMPDSLRSIGNNAFSGCELMEDIVLPDSLYAIGEWAFSNCKTLTKINIPDKVKVIQDFTFYGCTALESITIGDGVEAIRTYSTFQDCPIKKLVIGNGLKELPSVFANKPTLTDITLGKGISVIGYECFKGCTSLTKVTLPDNLNKIDGYSFYGCTNLQTINMPDSLRSIGNNAFDGCELMEDIVLPDSLNAIGEWAFSNCKTLTKINIPDKVKIINHHTFNGCTSLDTLRIGECVETINTWDTFKDCNNLRYVEFQNNLRTIESWFSGLEKLETVVLNDSVRIIGDQAFSNCKALKNIQLPKKLSTIGNNAFQQCNALTTINFPDSLSSI